MTPDEAEKLAREMRDAVDELNRNKFLGLMEALLECRADLEAEAARRGLRVVDLLREDGCGPEDFEMLRQLGNGLRILEQDGLRILEQEADHLDG